MTGESVTLEALGVPVRIEGLAPEAADEVRRAWSGLLSDEDAVSHVLHAPRDAPTAELLESITQRVTVTGLGACAGEMVMFHACALAQERRRRAAVLVGPSGVGKSTLSRTLGHDFTYLSDETAAVDDLGRVLAYPKPLSLIEAVGEPKAQVAPSDIGLRSGKGWYDVAAVALLVRTDAIRPTVSSVPTVRALAMLAEHTSYLAMLDQPLHRMARILEKAGGLRLVEYAESDQLGPLVAGWLA